MRNDGYDYQELQLEISDFIDDLPEEISLQEAMNFNLYNLKLKPWWKLAKTQFDSTNTGNDKGIPDVSKWIGAALVLSPRAFGLLEGYFSPYGELLPIEVNREVYYIFNCLNVKAIDNKSEKNYYEGEEVGWKKLVFPDETITSFEIFKSPDQGCIDLFCGNSFAGVFESTGLTGINFDSELGQNFKSPPPFRKVAIKT